MILGLIKPSFFHKKPGDEKLFTRKKILVNFSLLALLFMVLAAITAKPSETKETHISEAVNIEDMSEKEQIEYLVKDELKGQNNLKKDYLRELTVTEQIDGGWGVFVTFNADDNLTSNLRLTGVEKTMSEIYTTLFTSQHEIKQAHVTAYFPLIDQYGNEEDRIVYKSHLTSEVAEKVNWDADGATLRLQILPNLWEKSNLYYEFRKEE